MGPASCSDANAEALACFLPALARRRLLAAASGADAQHAATFPAALLFADISGFSKLAKRLAELKVEGAEELTTILNAYFGPMVDVIQAHGGDIVNFAGDAILAAWPAAPDGLATAVQRAAQGGFEVQLKLNNYEVIPDVRLSMRMSLGAGEVAAAALGGVGEYQQLAIVGQPLDQLWKADKCAKLGDVVLSPEAWALVRKQIDGEALADGHRRIKSIPRPIEPEPLAPVALEGHALAALRSYVHRPVLARIDAGQSDYLADLRRVTVMFVRFHGVDPTQASHLQTVMEILQTTMARYEGTVVQLMTDDKGTVGIPCFGLPPATHEDDAVRAHLAAEAIQAEVRAHGWQAGVGIATGRVFCGPLGSPARRIYTIMGSKVNLAARLMQNAQSGILCDEETERATRGRVRFRPLPRFVIKGLEEPVPVYRPAPLQVGHEAEQRLVGRVDECTAVEQALQETLAGTSAAVSIEGEAGIGKSTLVASLIERASTLGLRPLTSACSSIEKQTPYFGWRHVFTQLMGLDAIIAPAARRAQVLEQLPGDPEKLQLVSLLNPLLGVDFPTNEIANQLDGRTRAENLHAILLGFLERAAARQPLLIVMDDVQWLDSASWRFLQMAAERVSPLCLVIAMRPLPMPLPDEYSQLIGAPRTRRLKLDFLSRADCLELARRTTGIARLTDRLADYLFERSQGNPFFVIELSHYMRDAGLVTVTDGCCDLDGASDAAALSGTPTAIADLITSRIDQLSLSEQLTLKTASVIGRTFEHPTLQDVYPIAQERERLLEFLQMLDRQELTCLETVDPVRRYFFRHVTIQLTAYDQLPLANRQQLHREVALWYEARHGDDPSFAPLLAHHWGKAEVVEKHIEYQAKAGEAALRDGANREADNWFAQAIEQHRAKFGEAVDGEEQLRRARWLRGRGDALYHLGLFPESRSSLREALALFGRPVPNVRWKVRLNTNKQIIVQLWNRIRRRRALPRLADTRPGERSEQLQQTSLTNQRLARIGYFENQRDYALNHIFRAVNEGEAAGTSPALSRAYGKMCVCMSLVPNRFMAEHYANLAISAARATNDLASIADAQATICMFRLGMGEWGRVAEGAAEAVALSRTLADRERLAYGTTTQALLTCFKAQFRDSLAHFTQLHEIGLQGGNMVFQAWGLCGQGECQMRLGEYHRAIKLLEDTNRLLQGKDDRTEEIRASGLLAAAYWRSGQRTTALVHAEAATELLEACTFPTCTTLEGFAGPAEVYLDSWERDPGSQVFKPAATKGVQFVEWYGSVFPIGRPRALRLKGLLHWRLQEPRKAQKCWADSLAFAEQMELQFEAALARYEIGRHTNEALPARREHLEEALRIFSALGTKYERGLTYLALHPQEVSGQWSERTMRVRAGGF